MKQLFFMLICIIFANEVSAQAINKYGQGTSTVSDFVNKNGKVGNIPGLGKNGQLINAMIASLSTTSAFSISGSSAMSGGNISSDGGATVITRGVCWSTSTNPTIANNKTSNGNGAGSFSSLIDGLANNTTYYVRAYATNALGTAYGPQVSFTTLILPTLTTTALSAIASTGAVSGGNITNDGGAAITARGICWSTSSNPTIASNITTNGTGTGSFISTITGLTAGTTYYVRAYATNSIGTAYGNQLSFDAISIGDNYQGGKVAYILQPGDPGYVAGQQHGLIAAPSDQINGIGWRNVEYVLTGATATALGTGLANTNTIVARQGTGNYAASICYNLYLGGHSDWYLPSKDELNKLYINRVAIGGFVSFPDTMYWSSSESDLQHAWLQNFTFGSQGAADKIIYDQGWAVRAVRSF